MQRLKTAEIKPPLRSEQPTSIVSLPSAAANAAKAANAARPFRVCVPNGLGRGRKLANHSSAPSFSSLSPWREGFRERERERGARRHSGRRANPIPPHHSLLPSFVLPPFLGGSGKAAPSWSDSDGKIRENGRGGPSNHPTATAACVTACLQSSNLAAEK